VKTIGDATSDPKVASALEAFERLLLNNLTLVRAFFAEIQAKFVPANRGRRCENRLHR
jgi:hypothetical protein